MAPGWAFIAASDPDINSRAIHGGGVFQVSVVHPVYEIRKSGKGRSFRSVGHDFGSIHQIFQRIPEILMAVIHFIFSVKPGLSPAHKLQGLKLTI